MAVIARAVGWNWTNSRSASAAPGGARRSSPSPVAPRGFVVRDQSAAYPPVARTTRATPRAVSTSPATRHPTRVPSSKRMRGCSPARSVKDVGDVPCQCRPRRHGRRARASGRLRGRAHRRTDSELDEATQSARAPPSVRSSTALGRQMPRPARERVGGVKSRVVALADRGGDSALRRVAVGRGVGRLRKDCDRRAFVGGGESGESPAIPAPTM